MEQEVRRTFGKRLSAARKMANLSLDDLSKRTGIRLSRQAISKYEHGQALPKSTILLALARALGVSVDSLFRSFHSGITDLRFRKRGPLSDGQVERIRIEALEFLERYLEIENILNISHQADLPEIRRKQIRTAGDVEQAAQDVRRYWNWGDDPIHELTALLEERGFRILEVVGQTPFDGLSGFTQENHIPVMAICNDVDLVRKRFTLGHELAHLLLEFPDAKQEHCESWCHAFAGALLLPGPVMFRALGEKRCNITLWELKKLKGIYGISMQAIMARAQNLGIINKNTHNHFKAVLRQNDWLKREPGAFYGTERANRFKQLVLRAVAEKVISLAKGAELLRMDREQIEQEVRIVS